MDNLKISYPLIFTNHRLGRACYPKRKGKILIYVADHLHYCTDNINRLIDELNITLLEEITHIFHEGRTPRKHDWEHILEAT